MPRGRKVNFSAESELEVRRGLTSVQRRILDLPMIRIYGTVLAGLLGLAFGSFLNVCLSRWPAGESVVKPGSHCRSCGRTLAWWENIPVLSWVALRGRCRTCGRTISWRYPVVELAVGVLWALVGWRLMTQIVYLDTTTNFLIGPPSWGVLPALFTSAFVWILVGLAFLDAGFLWLPDAITLGGSVIGLLLPMIALNLTTARLSVGTTALRILEERLIAIAISAALILLIRWMYKLIRKREGIGLGDAKLMAMLGAWLGLQGALLAFVLGVVLGAIVAVVMLALPRRKDERWAAMKLPLGTFLCVGGIVSALWGPQIISAYARYAGF